MNLRLRALVKPAGRNNEVEKIADNEFRITVTAPARDGLANQAVIEALAAYFAIPKSSVTIIRGHAARTKFIQIDK